MELKSEKCVMVIDRTLPPGMIANTAGIIEEQAKEESIRFLKITC